MSQFMTRCNLKRIRALVLPTLLLSTWTQLAHAFFQDTSEPPAVLTGSSDLSRAAEALKQGESHLQLGEYQLAGPLLAEAARLDRDDPRGLFYFAVCQIALGDLVPAANTVHEVMTRSPDFASTPINLRETLVDTLTIDKRLAEIYQAAHLQNKSSEMRFLLGFMQYYCGEPMEGAITLRSYIAATPDDWTIRPFVDIAISTVGPLPPPAPAPGPQPSTGKPRINQPVTGSNKVQKGTTDPAVNRNRTSTGQQPPSDSTASVPLRFKSRSAQQSTSSNPDIPKIATNEFCRVRKLNPVRNKVIATVLSQTYDKKDPRLLNAKVRLKWVEWKIKEGDDGELVRQGKEKSDTARLYFDAHGRLVKFTD